MSTAKHVDAAGNAALFILKDEIHEPMHDRFLWATMQRARRGSRVCPGVGGTAAVGLGDQGTHADTSGSIP